MADEEALLVVIRVDEPAGDTVGPVAADLASIRMEHVNAIDLHPDFAVIGRENVDVRLAENDKQIAFAGVFEVIGHVEVGVHAGLQNGDTAQLAELSRVRLVVEGAGDQHVEVRVSSLAGGSHEVRAGDGAELRADEDGSALLRAGVAAFQIAAFSAD